MTPQSHERHASGAARRRLAPGGDPLLLTVVTARVLRLRLRMTTSGES